MSVEKRASAIRSLVWLVLGLLALQGMTGQAAGPGPVGWYAGDMHVHRSCGGSPVTVTSIYDTMVSQDLSVISLLADMGNGEVQNPTTDLPLVNGKDASVSTAGRIVHWDVEWHWDATYSQYAHQALGGHIVALGLTNASQMWNEMTYPILDWARRQGGIAGFAHFQYLDDSFPQSLSCCTPVEYPVEVALGACDFISEDVGGSDYFLHAYYRLLNCGFRPGFAAGSDNPCGSTIGPMLTYSQCAGNQLTYGNWLQGIKNGRTVISRNGRNEFVDLKVNTSNGPGDEIQLTGGGDVQVSVAWTATQTLTGTLELVRDGVVIASKQGTAAVGAPVTLTSSVTFAKSGWLCARRMGSSGHTVHTAAVFVTVDQKPVRVSSSDAQFYVQWTDNLLQNTSPGGVWNSYFPTSLAAAQARYSAARAIYQRIVTEAGGIQTLNVMLGNGNDGMSIDPIWGGGAWINAARFQASSNMTVTTMGAKVAAVAGHYKCAVYTDSSSGPSVLLRNTSEISSPGGGWQVFPLTSSLTLTNGSSYWLAIWSDDPNAGVYFSDNAGTVRWGQYNYGTWPSPISTSGGGNPDYCLYAAGPPASLTSITVTPASTAILTGSSQQFTASGTYSDGTTQDITTHATWSSANTGVASINAVGQATALSAGTSIISATDGTISGSALLTVQSGPLAILTTSLPSGTVNSAYAATIAASGGTAPYSWSVASGSLPPGLSLNPGGAVAGTPTATGVYSFTAGVSDSGNPVQTASMPLSLAIASALSGGTIGNTNDGTLTNSIWDSSPWVNANRFQAGSNMTVSTVHAKVGTISGKYKCAIYSDSGAEPSRLLASTAEISSPASGWQTFPLGSSVAMTNASYYWLAIWSDNATAKVYYSGTTGSLRWGQYSYGLWPDPITTSGGGNLNYCIYAAGATAPPPSLNSIAVTPANPTVTVGAQQQFTATGAYSDGSTQNLTGQVTWTSSSTAVASINTSGLATSVSAGHTTISAALSAVSGSTALTVQVSAVAIATAALPGGTMGTAYVATLAASGGTTPYAWSIIGGALPSGLTLNETSGTINGTPTAAGTSSFTVQVSDSTHTAQTATKSLSITIAPSLTSISVTPVSPIVVVGATQQLTARGTYSDGSSQDLTSQASWTSSDAGVASVSASGLTTGVSAGTATIMAAMGGFSGGATATILSLPAGVGDYRTAGSGIWSVAASWQTNNGVAWVAASRPPTNSSAAGVIAIRSGHTVAVSSAVTVDQVLVEAGGQVTISNVTLTVANGTGTDLDVFGTVVLTGSSGVLSASSGARIVFESGATYQHARPAGTIPTATWNAKSTCLITGSTSALPGSLGQTFGNFTWNCAGQSAALNLETSMSIAGNFTVSSTAGNTLRIANSSTSRTVTVGGDFSQSAGTFVVASGTGAAALNISSNFTLSGGTFILKDAAGNANLNVTGDYSQTGGIFDLRAANTSGSGTVTVARNFSLASGTFDLSGVGAVGTLSVGGNFSHTGGTLTETSSGSGSIVFTSGLHSYVSGGTVANTVNYNVNSGASLMLGTSLLGNGSAGTFTLASGATLGIGDPAGISTSGATGNIRVTGTRSFNAGANYTYDGTAAQVTGSGLPATVNNLTITSVGGLTLNTTNTVNGTCLVASGARLLGTGRINGGPLILLGDIAPGVGVGRFTSGSETWNGGGGYTWEINNATGTPASGWDLLSLSNGQGIDLQSATTNRFTVKLITLNGSSQGLAANFSKSNTYTWTIAIATNATVTNFAADKFLLDTAQFSNDFGGGRFSVEQSGQELRLKFTGEPSGLTIGTSSLADGSQHLSYAATLMASGGVTPYTWSLPSGSLPPGLALDAGSGAIVGTPDAVGAFDFTVEVSDSSNPKQTATKSLTITVAPMLTSITVAPANPTNVIGTTRQFTATGRYSDGTTQDLTSQATWTSSNTTVATLNAGGLATGVTAGITTISATIGGVNGAATLTIQPLPLAITTASLPNGTVSTTYTAALAASGGTAPYTWSLASGALPTGLALNSAGGIAGTPTATGTSSFTVGATDAGRPARTATALLSITINPAGTPGIIGNVAEGTLTDSQWYNGAWINAGRFQAASNMTVSAMQAKVTAISGKYKCAIYSDSGSQPSRLLRSTAEVSNPTTGWQTFPLTSSLVLTNGLYYWLAIWSDNANAQVYYSGNGGTLRWQQVNYGNWPDPMATSGGGNLNYCIYATGLGTVFFGVASVTPGVGASGVSLGAPVTVTFTSAMDGSTINTNTILLRDFADTVVPATVSYDNASMTATLTPSGLLKAATPYTATVKGGEGGVVNLAGSKLSSDSIWTFRTDPYGDGPGGPILVLTQATNAFTRVLCGDSPDRGVERVRSYERVLYFKLRTGGLRYGDPRPDCIDAISGHAADRLGQLRREADRHATGPAVDRASRLDRCGINPCGWIHPGEYQFRSRGWDCGADDPISRYGRSLHAGERHQPGNALFRRSNPNRQSRGNAPKRRSQWRAGRSVYIRFGAFDCLHAPGKPGLGGPKPRRSRYQ